MLKSIWEKYKKYIIAFGVVFLLLILFSFSGGKDYATKMIDRFIQQQRDLIMKENKERIASMQEEINSLKDKNTAYDKKMKEMTKKIGGLENEIQENKLPETTDEMWNRFRNLGFEPIN